jgi:hypothetical protein
MRLNGLISQFGSLCPLQGPCKEQLPLVTYSRTVCNVTLSVYPHQASLKNMPGHSGNRTYDLWNTSPRVTLRVTLQTSYSPEYTTPTQ